LSDKKIERLHIEKRSIRGFFGFLHEHLPKFSIRGVIHTVSLTLITLLAFCVRILPLRWGAYLSEFDPFWHYDVAKYAVDHGFLSVFDWHDTSTWFPYGRDAADTTPLGLPFTATAFYYILRALGFQVSVLDVCIFMPPFMAAVTCIAIYFLAKNIHGKEAGLLAALFLALNNAYISRTTLGFFKHETVGIFAIVLSSIFFLRALDAKKSIEKSIMYAIFAGLAIAYLNISWGAYIYLSDLIALFAIILVFIGRYRPRLFLTFSIAVGLSLILTLPFPRHGSEILTSSGSLPILAAFLILGLYEFLRHFKSLQTKFLLTLALVCAGAFGLFLLAQIGFATPLAGKITIVLNPTERVFSPIAESVAEHRISTWATFYHEFGNLVFLAPLGLYFAFKRRRNEDVYLILFGLTTLYFGSSMVRLTLIVAPALCLLGAYGLVEVAKPFVEMMRGVELLPRMKLAPRLAPEFGLIFVLILSLLMVPTFLKAVDSAYAPVTIASSSAPTRQFYGDWLEALAWIENNIPPGSAVLSWWDYGYWVAIGGNSSSIADNATLNTTQIANIGQILLSNESVAFTLAKEYFNSEYILVFVTTYTQSSGSSPSLGGFGDEGKWVWMADIAHGVHPEISQESVRENWGSSDSPLYLPNKNTIVGKCILYALGQNPTWTNCSVAFVSSSHSTINQAGLAPQVIILKANRS
jgi:dolichyl-diphosphooligosaccharide--protein glycosyltransferase